MYCVCPYICCLQPVGEGEEGEEGEAQKGEEGVEQRYVEMVVIWTWTESLLILLQM